MNWNNLLMKEHFIKRDSKFELLERNDYDTIICSTLFRRLQDKAQVFPLEEDDYVRTRLTHSLEVSAIGKKLGEYVFNRLKNISMDDWFKNHTAKDFSDVLLCAGLIHDIGNPPFGHFGEYAIREWFQNNIKELKCGEIMVSDFLTEGQLEDLYLFEGNAQSLRLLSKTPYLGEMNGFNLSYAVLGSIIKYPICSEKIKKENVSGYKKIGYYHSEKKLFEEINLKTGMNGCRHPSSYLLEAADDIAYRTSDLEDAMVKKVISFHQICRVFEECMKKMNISKKAEKEIKSHISLLHQLYQEEISKNKRKPELTSVQRWNQCMKEMMIKEAQGKTEQEKLYLRILMITDYISGMTDNYAKKLYQDLFS